MKHDEKFRDEDDDVKSEDSYDPNNDYFKDESEEEEDQSKGKKGKKPELKELFPHVKAAEFKQTGKKLSTDEISIMKQLIKKYGDDYKVRVLLLLTALQKMFKDIKLNFMQWSKGELKTKYNLYFKNGCDKRK